VAGELENDKFQFPDISNSYVYFSDNVQAKSITIKSSSSSEKRVFDFTGVETGLLYFININNESGLSMSVNLDKIQVKGFNSSNGNVIKSSASGSTSTNPCLSLTLTSCVLGDEEEGQATSSAYSNYVDSVIDAYGVKLTLDSNTVIQRNYGKAIYLNSGISSYSELNISNCKIINNTASSDLPYAGVYTASKTNIGAGTIIKNNKATDTSGNLYNSNLYLDDTLITVTEALTNSTVYLSHSDRPRAQGDSNCQVTSAYSSYNSGTSPSTYFKSDSPVNGITWNSETNPSEAVLIYQFEAQGGFSYTQDDITFSINRNTVNSDSNTNIVVTASINLDSSAIDITSSTQASDWTLRVYCDGEDVTSSSYFTVTNTDGSPATRSIGIGSGIDVGTRMQLYVSLAYNGKTYGGSFDLEVE